MPLTVARLIGGKAGIDAFTELRWITIETRRRYGAKKDLTAAKQNGATSSA
jgi:hypothetical protein